MLTSDDRLALEIFLGIAALAFAFGFWIRRREHAARDWPQTPGVIVTSTTLRQPVGNGTYEVSPVIEYEFSHDGRSFRSNHWRPFNFSVGNSISAQAVISRYPVGQPVTVFVNPRNPMRSVLEFQPSWLCWIPFGFAILCVSLSGLAFYVVFVTRR